MQPHKITVSSLCFTGEIHSGLKASSLFLHIYTLLSLRITIWLSFEKMTLFSHCLSMLILLNTMLLSSVCLLGKSLFFSYKHSDDISDSLENATQFFWDTFLFSLLLKLSVTSANGVFLLALTCHKIFLPSPSLILFFRPVLGAVLTVSRLQKYL